MTNLDVLAEKLRALRDEWGDDVAHAAFEKQSGALPTPIRTQLALLAFGNATNGDISIDAGAASSIARSDVSLNADATIDGVAVGVNLGTIIYGRAPDEDERRRLVWYLARLAARLRRLPLRGLDPYLDENSAGLDLGRVYIELATVEQLIAGHGPPHDLSRYLDNAEHPLRLKPIYSPDIALPSGAIVKVAAIRSEHDEGGLNQEIAERILNDERGTPTNPTRTFFKTRNIAIGDMVLWRAYLAAEAVYQYQYLVLLGDPGSGKTCFLRYLAWALARRGLDQQDDTPALTGWDGPHSLTPSSVATGEGVSPPAPGARSIQHQVLPILIPLRKLAGRLARGEPGDTTVYAALYEEMQSYNIGPVDDLLSESLHRGAALLLLDGLDEVPLDAVPGVTADRLTTLRAVRDFAQLHTAARVVITCRTCAFDERWKKWLGWRISAIAPFTLGQIRHFIPSWYAELVATGQLDSFQATRLEQELLDAILSSPELYDKARTPLLLTMMALALYHDGALPRDRSLLYERMLELLLGQGHKGKEGQSLAEAIGQHGWGSDRIRPLLDQLSYQAHVTALSEDGRGRLSRNDIYRGLIEFFQAAQIKDAQGAAGRCLNYFEQRSGLLVPDGPDSHVFAHLTFQEHCAGRHMLFSPEAAALVLQHRTDDRWREPIFLGMGVVQKTNPALIDRILGDLTDPEEQGKPKPAERRQRDLILAAEIGKDRDWNYLRTQRVNVERLQRDLRQGFAALLKDTTQPLPVAERIQAAWLLGDLGDPRFPVTMEEWQHETAQRSRRFGAAEGYWCYVPPGAYRLGSPNTLWHSISIALPAFWIARFPVTAAQFAPFAAAEGKHSPDFRHPNQPMAAVTWEEADAWAAWLSEQLGAVLPPGYTIRLPLEAEWEVAAAYATPHQRRSYPWGAAEPTPELAIYEANGLAAPAPVGCCPAGAAACGAYDMAGNVWEWADHWEHYPDKSSGFYVPCGGSYRDPPSALHCDKRGSLSSPASPAGGFRVVLAPRG